MLVLVLALLAPARMAPVLAGAAAQPPAAPAPAAGPPQPSAPAPSSPPPAPPAAPAPGAPLPGPSSRPPGPGAVPVQPLESAITLAPGASCLERERLVRRVARWLRRDAIDARIRIDVRGDASDKNRVQFRIDRGGEHAERTLADAALDCEQLHAAVALSIALAIDASLMGEGAKAAALPSDEQLLAPAPREKPGPPYFRLGLGVLGQATSGLLTDPAWAASSRVELGFVPWLDLRLGVMASQLDHQSLRGTPEGSTFYVALLAGRLDACGAVDAANRLRVLGCLGVIAGALVTRGRGFSPELTQSVPWSAMVGGIEAQAMLAPPWLALAGSVDLAVPLAKHHIQALDAQGGVAGERALTPVAVLIGVGPVLRFF